MKRFVIDEDWCGEKFWNNFQEKIKGCPVEAFKVINVKSCDCDRVVLTNAEAEIVDKWIAEIDGVKEYCNDYSNGPFLIQDCEEYKELESLDWVELDKDLSIKLYPNGNLKVAMQDTEGDDPDWESIFEKYGLEAEIIGNGEWKGDYYLESFTRDQWSLR